MSSSYRLELDRWLRELTVEADSCLDVGGSQLPVKNRVKSWKVNEYFISDLETPHVGSPKPDIIMDINKPWPGLNQYQTIFCLEVFDYVYDPMTAMKNIAKLLEPGGNAWVTFPAFYPHHQPIEDDALRYMEAGINKLAQEVDLAITQMIKRRPETNLLELFWRTERMRAAKRFDHRLTGYIVELVK